MSTAFHDNCYDNLKLQLGSNCSNTALTHSLPLFCCDNRDGHSVLVHGSEGTDTSLLVCTLAQLILDPEARTLKGFLSLLEREWVQVGILNLAQT